jgi:hypothetical protein
LDLRLKILHSPDSVDWNLQIADLLIEDSGLYECQVGRGNFLLASTKFR